MKKGLLLLAGAMLATTSAFAGVEKLYGIGQINADWGNFSGPTVGLELESTSDGVFVWEGEVAAVAYFAFTSELGTWDAINGHRFSPAVKDALVVEGDNAMVANVDSSWKIEPGNYKFIIDTNNMVLNVTLTQEVEKVTTYVIHGQLDGLADTDWIDYPLTSNADGSEWSAVVTPSVSGGEFGIQEQINGSASTWYANGVSFDAENTTAVLDGSVDGNCVFDGEAGKAYKFVFTLATATLSVTPDGTGSVAGIEAASDEAPVYFNMQGVRVANPENGIFIVRQGDKVSKQVIR